MRYFRAKRKLVEASQLGSGDYVVVDQGQPRIVPQDAFEDAFEPAEADDLIRGEVDDTPRSGTFDGIARALAGVTKKSL